MAQALHPIVTWRSTRYGSEVELAQGSITITPNGKAYDSESDFIYRALLAARRARRSGHVDLPK